MFKSIIASVGLTLVKRFMSYVFGGLPPVNNKELFRQWCLKNHRYLALLVSKTSNQWDDQFSAVLLQCLETPEIYNLIWDNLTGFLSESVNVPLTKRQRFVERVLSLIYEGGICRNAQ